jgi:hypothetical protein
VRGSGVLACSSSLLLYGHLGRCQAETPLIQLSKFVRPALHDGLSLAALVAG